MAQTKRGGTLAERLAARAAAQDELAPAPTAAPRSRRRGRGGADAGRAREGRAIEAVPDVDDRTEAVGGSPSDTDVATSDTHDPAAPAASPADLITLDETSDETTVEDVDRPADAGATAPDGATDAPTTPSPDPIPPGDTPADDGTSRPSVDPDVGSEPAADTTDPHDPGGAPAAAAQIGDAPTTPRDDGATDSVRARDGSRPEADHPAGDHSGDGHQDAQVESAPDVVVRPRRSRRRRSRGDDRPPTSGRRSAVVAAASAPAPARPDEHGAQDHQDPPATAAVADETVGRTDDGATVAATEPPEGPGTVITGGAAAGATEPVTPTARRIRPARRGVGSRLLPTPSERLTEREPRDVLNLTVAISRGLGLVSAAVLLALSIADTPALPYAFAVAMALTLFRLWQPAHGLTGHLVEVAAVAGILVAAEGMLGPFSLFAAATALAVGADRGLGTALLSGTVLSSAGVAATTVAVRGDVDAAIIASWVLLYPLMGALGSLTARALDVDRDGNAALRDVNRVLRSLRTVAGEAPAALQTTTVARAIAGELAETLDAAAVVVLLHREGALVELGRRGEVDTGHILLTRDWEPLLGEGSRPLESTPLPPQLRAALGGRDWRSMRLESNDRLVGVVLVDADEPARDRETRRALGRTSTEIAIALDNATLFSEIERLAAGAERQRIADDLHDGVAQQLTHVRFELELLRRHVDDASVRDELERLARVAHQATDDVRSSIRGLRATALDAGLGNAVRALVADMDAANGPELIVDIRTPTGLDVDVETEVFRIIQESLSNALRHAAADHVLIEIDDLDGTLVVVIEDDGEGLEATADDPSDGDGLGLDTMQARAQRIGGHLDVGGNELGGVRIELRLPPRGTRHLDDGMDSGE